MNLFSHIKEQVNMLDVAREYVSLKRAGLYYKGRCPFHQEQDASFTVSPHKEIFYCFGCHATGDVIAFIAQIERCSQLEAARLLIEKYDIEIPQQLLTPETMNIVSNDEKQRYYALCKLVASWCHEQLHQSQAARSYLDSRAINEQITQTFTIGYFPNGPKSIKNLTQYLQPHGFLLKDLLNAGIVNQGATYYSPFEDRIIFPITDHLGRHCGFGGRIFIPNDERAKYYNSRENNFFNKGALLFGLEQAKDAIQKNESVFLVEGYTDCIGMAQHGYLNTVATLGTACTSTHLQTISRYVDRVYVLYDGDNAGIQAVLRLTSLCWDVNIELWVINLPKGEDPASFLGGGNKMQGLVQQARDIFSFFIQSSSAQFHTQSLKKKLTIVQHMIRIVAHISDQLKRDLLLQEMAHVTHMPFETLRRATRMFNSEKNTIAPATIEPQEPVTQIAEHEKKFFALLIKVPRLLNTPESDLLISHMPEPIKSALHAAQKTPEHATSSALAGVSPVEQQILNSILMTHESMQENEQETIIHECIKQYWKIVSSELKERIIHAQKNNDLLTVTALLNQFQELKKNIVNRSFTWQKK